MRIRHTAFAALRHCNATIARNFGIGLVVVLIVSLLATFVSTAGSTIVSNLANTITTKGTAKPEAGTQPNASHALLRSAPLVINAPTGLAVNSVSSSSIILAWIAPGGTVDSYQVERSQSLAGPFSQVGTALVTNFNDATVSSNNSYLYRVRAVSGGVPSAPSSVALGTAVSFTDPALKTIVDDPTGLTVTQIRAVHVTELRTAVNAVRAVAGLGAATWTDSSLSGVKIQAVHIQQLRDRLNEGLTALNLSPVSYTDPVLSTGATGTLVKKVHIEQLRLGASGLASVPWAITVGIADATGVYVPDNYTTFTPPAKGNTYVDSIAGVTVKRMTNGFIDIPNGGYTGEYGRPSHYNFNNSRLLVTDSVNGGFYIIDPTTLNVTNNLGIGGADEPIWDHSDPDVIWYNQSNQLKKYNAATNTHTVVATFNGVGGLPNFTKIDFGGGASDISEDGDHIMIAGDDWKFGIYKFSTNEYTSSPVDLSNTETGFCNGFITYDNHLAIGCPFGYDPLGGTVSVNSGTNTVTGVGTSFTTKLRQGSVLFFSTMTGGLKEYVVSNVVNNTSLILETNVTGTVSGVSIRSLPRYILYSKTGSYLRVLSKYTGHGSWGRDPSTGQEIMLIDGANSFGGSPCPSGDGMIRFNLSDASQSCVVDFPDFNLTGHYSFDNYRGHPWAALVLYDGRTTSAGTDRLNAILRPDWAAVGVWKRFYNEVFIVNIVTGQIRRLVHFRSRITGGQGYWFSGRGALSPDVSRYTFSSNMMTFHHLTGFGTVSTTSGSNVVTGSTSPDASFYASVSSLALGGEITIGGVTKIVTDVTPDPDTNTLTTDSNWAATNTNVTYTAWRPDITDLYQFDLRAGATDFTAPTMSNFSVTNITTNSATVEWNTDEASTSQVEWGTTTFYGGGISAFDVSKVTSHSVTLTGLPSGQTIHIRRKSRDAAGNIKLDSNRTFSTS